MGYVVNRNDLVGRVPWINGVKTGHTAGAGYVLVASGTQNGMTLIGSVLGTSSEAARDQNALALLDYGFAEFRMRQAGRRRTGARAGRPSRTRPGVRATVIAGASFERVVSRAYDVRLRVVAPAQLAGPLRRDAVVGYVGVVIGAAHDGADPAAAGARAAGRVSTVTLARQVSSARWIVFGLAMLVVGARGSGAGAPALAYANHAGETLEAG